MKKVQIDMPVKIIKNSIDIFLILFFITSTRHAFPAAKIRKEGLWKVLNVWTKSHFSNFEVGWPTLLWSRKCLFVVLEYMQIITGSIKTKKSCVFRKMFEMEFKCSKLTKIIVFRCLRANKTVGCSEYSIRFA